MRISDWSSDVCSSDLEVGECACSRLRRFRAGLRPARGRDSHFRPWRASPELGRRSSRKARDISNVWTPDTRTNGPARISGRERDLDIPGRTTIQIGRASCREKVVSVRVVLGGSRFIKKKKTKITKAETP